MGQPWNGAAYYVDDAGLAPAAQRSRELAAELRSHKGFGESAAVRVAAAFGSWGVSMPLAQCRQQWTSNIEELAAQYDEVGERIDAAIAAYRSAEDGARGGFGDVGVR